METESIRGGDSIRKRASYDFYLILATVAVLFAISAICIYGMFFFKFAQVHEMAPAVKAAYMMGMNRIMAPFLILLLLLLGVCVPKRLLPTQWLNRFAVLIGFAAMGVSLWQGVVAGLLVILVASLFLQAAVLVLALIGSEALHFEKKGYWVRVGSSLIHLGLILFVLDLFLFRYQTLHLILFWVTTIATVAGLLASFYAENVVNGVRRIRGGGGEETVAD